MLLLNSWASLNWSAHIPHIFMVQAPNESKTLPQHLVNTMEYWYRLEELSQWEKYWEMSVSIMGMPKR